MRNFDEVNASASVAKEQFERTFRVYEALKKMNEPATPSEIARAANYTFTGAYHLVVHPLFWLCEMGLVDKISYEEEITFPCTGYYEDDVRIIDGKVYTRSEWVPADNVTKKVTRHKWYVKKQGMSLLRPGADANYFHKKN